MKLVLITQDEPLYAPRYVGAILGSLGRSHSVVGITALDPAGHMGWWRLARQRLAMYGPVDFARAAGRFVIGRARGLAPGTTAGNSSVRRLAGQHGIAMIDTADVNDEEYVLALRRHSPDLVVSVAANQLFGAELLSLGVINIHSSLLPAYRGLDGLFWALVNGEPEVGVTVHEMTDRIDGGRIVGQARIPVGDDDSLHDLYLKAIDAGAALLSRVVEQYEAGTVEFSPNDPAAGSYHSWPTPEAARRFRARGRRFF